MLQPKHIETHPIVLGNLEIGPKRRAALLAWAQELGLTWNGKPSISRLMQHLADLRIKQATDLDVTTLQARIAELEKQLKMQARKAKTAPNIR